MLYRPWLDAQVIPHTHAITRTNQKKGGLSGWWKAHPKVKLHGLILPVKILNSLSRIHYNWFKRINFKMILLTLLFKSLFFFKINLNCSYVWLLDMFSTVMQWGFCIYVLSKKIKTGIFNKSVFASRKLIVII